MSSLAESGRRAGEHCWVERRLFEILGGWVATVVDVDAKLMLDRHSQHHAWRAGQWWDRLPVLAGVDRDALVRPPSPGWPAALDDLASLTSPVARLAGAYRCALPRLASAYREHRQGASPIADGAVIRTLDHVAGDIALDWAEGEAVTESALRSPADVDEAAATTARLERLLIHADASVDD
ncbi:MAG: hypothetical protein J2P57_05135 [Acidimicrobiaceae bacterium]|nr:hypothetical protein [Acidimicrobiaceae bacterium]